MSNLLCSILITTPQTYPTTAEFWRDVWEAIHQSASFKSVHATPANVTASENNSVDSPISVWSSRDIIPKPPMAQDLEGQQVLFGFFFRAPLSQESDASAFLQRLVERLGGSVSLDISTVDCRVYRQLPGYESGELVPVHKGIIIVNCMTPSEETEGSFNRWYADEHIPMLSAVPGWLSSTRYILIDSTYVSVKTKQEDKRIPKYLALHEWVDEGIFEKVEYRSAVDTPWRTEVIAAVQERQRFVLRYNGILDDLVRIGFDDKRQE